MKNDIKGKWAATIMGFCPYCGTPYSQYVGLNDCPEGITYQRTFCCNNNHCMKRLVIDIAVKPLGKKSEPPTRGGRRLVMDAIDELKMIKHGATTDHLRDAILALADRVEMAFGEIQKLDIQYEGLHRDICELHEDPPPAASEEWPVWRIDRKWGNVYRDKQAYGFSEYLVEEIIRDYTALLTAYRKLLGEKGGSDAE